MALVRRAAVLLALLFSAGLWPVAVSAQEVASRPIRVVLGESELTQVISGNIVWSTADTVLGKTTGEVSVTRAGSDVRTVFNGREYTAARLVAQPREGYIQYGERRYRGWFELFAGRAGGVVVLNVLDLEDYLLGVVASEMPAGWPEEALKAQAVAARTYALARMRHQNFNTFDVVATQGDQVYKGVDGEHPRTTAAVEATAGQVLLYDGTPITAYFSADAGGHTRDGNYPYLVGVPSHAPDSPHNHWSFELNRAELNELSGASGGNIGSLKAVELVYAERTGYLESLILAGDRGTHTFSGPELRRYIGLSVMKSTRVDITPLGGAVAAEITNPVAIPPTAGTPEVQLTSQFDTLEYQGYERAWVAGAEGVADRKVRRLYAYDGWDTRRMAGSCHALAGVQLIPLESAPRPPAALTPHKRLRIEIDNGFAGLKFNGSGYGHGLGMSQWGAQQLASEGLSYDAILRHFYTEVELVRWNGMMEVPEVD